MMQETAKERKKPCESMRLKRAGHTARRPVCTAAEEPRAGILEGSRTESVCL